MLDDREIPELMIIHKYLGFSLALRICFEVVDIS
jgi:hypothetical protein